MWLSLLYSKVFYINSLAMIIPILSIIITKFRECTAQILLYGKPLSGNGMHQFGLPTVSRHGVQNKSTAKLQNA